CPRPWLARHRRETRRRSREGFSCSRLYQRGAPQAPVCESCCPRSKAWFHPSRLGPSLSAAPPAPPRLRPIEFTNKAQAELALPPAPPDAAVQLNLGTNDKEKSHVHDKSHSEHRRSGRQPAQRLSRIRPIALARFHSPQHHPQRRAQENDRQ